MPISRTAFMHWPVNEHPISLGGLLVLRKELEFLAEIRQIHRFCVFFTGVSELPLYLTEALAGSLKISAVVSETCPEKIFWPLSFESLKRVSWLSSLLERRPILFVKEEDARQAQEFLDAIGTREHRNIMVHLKNCLGGSEESNANMNAWGTVFEENRDVKFILLGSDIMPEWILGMPNVVSCQAKGLSLSVQLALCQISDGFVGMASGLCNAACFSLKPYVIFKHPLHHAEEMKFELGALDNFLFAGPKQFLWREVDNVENIRKAILEVCSCY